MSKRVLWIASIASFLFGVGLCLIAPQVLDKVLPSTSEGPTERFRITSPDGQLDAVLIREGWGGAMGGFDWFVYIVRRGKPVPAKGLTPIFLASRLVHEQLVWREPRLLVIQYDMAEIESFRNLWCSSEIEDVGANGEHQYCVEVCLSPMNAHSILTPEGVFRQH